MRGGGRLFLLLGVVIAAAAALLLLFFLQPQTAVPDPNAQLPPTTIVRVKVITARLDLPINSIITDTRFLASDEITETEFNAQKGAYFTNETELLNKVTVSALAANQPIRKSDVVDGGLLPVQLAGATLEIGLHVIQQLRDIQFMGLEAHLLAVAEEEMQFRFGAGGRCAQAVELAPVGQNLV